MTHTTHQDRYAATRERVLRLPSLAQESVGATRAAQFHFLPSFHTEAAISVIEFSDMAAVVVRVPQRDIHAWEREVPAYGEHLKPRLPPKAFSETAWFPLSRLKGYQGAVEAMRVAPGLEVDAVACLDGDQLEAYFSEQEVEPYSHGMQDFTHPGHPVSWQVAKLAWEATELEAVRKVVAHLRSSLKRAP